MTAAFTHFRKVLAKKPIDRWSGSTFVAPLRQLKISLHASCGTDFGLAYDLEYQMAPTVG
jgi:hypothetical protein